MCTLKCLFKKKRIKDFNVKSLHLRPETIELPENIESKLFDIDLSNIFLPMSPQAKETKPRMNKKDRIKLKEPLNNGGNYTKRKGHLTSGRKYLKMM